MAVMRNSEEVVALYYLLPLQQEWWLSWHCGLS